MDFVDSLIFSFSSFGLVVFTLLGLAVSALDDFTSALADRRGAAFTVLSDVCFGASAFNSGDLGLISFGLSGFGVTGLGSVGRVGACCRGSTVSGAGLESPGRGRGTVMELVSSVDCPSFRLDCLRLTTLGAELGSCR